MKGRAIFCALILAAAVGALAFRLPRLNQRPMHTDEAVQAVKAGALAETGVYRYDPVEYHGPTLYYLSLPALWATSHGKLAESDEGALRIVPVLFGVGLVLLVLLIGDGLGRQATVWAGVLTAVSPAMVFYSRFYIQEMILVFFTFAAIVTGWRYVRSRRLAWALLAGAALGLMHATKETCVIAYGSMLMALTLTLLWRGRGAGEHVRRPLNGKHLVAAAVAGCALSALLFSSFFTNPSGPLDSLRTYAGYLHKGANSSLHQYPWYYYLKTLIYTRYAPGPWWSEGLILGLAVIGFAAVMRGGKAIEGDLSLLRFVAFYALAMTLAYSIIPYKTPWCMLSFFQGIILLAGVGAAAILKALPNVPAKAAACVLLAAGTCQLGWQAYKAAFPFCADNRNPYVYAHSSTDVLNLVAQLEEIAKTHPDGHNMLIQVIVPDSDYWPLPWYLRRFGRVGYWNRAIPADLDAPVVIAPIDLDLGLGGSHQICYFGLRPGVVLRIYVKAEAWDAFMRRRANGKSG